MFMWYLQLEFYHTSFQLICGDLWLSSTVGKKTDQQIVIHQQSSMVFSANWVAALLLLALGVVAITECPSGFPQTGVKVVRCDLCLNKEAQVRICKKSDTELKVTCVNLQRPLGCYLVIRADFAGVLRSVICLCRRIEL